MSIRCNFKNWIPYTYVITCLITNQKYYGVRYKKNCNPIELGVTYFSSSWHVKELIKQYGINEFKFEIRKTFNDRNKACEWESRVLQKLDLRNNPNWLNKHNNIGPFYAKETHSPETRRKISQSNSGKKLSEERKKRISEAQKGRIKSVDHLEKISKSLKGKAFTDQHRKNISDGMKGVSPSLKAREKLSKFFLGRSISEEHKLKISVGNKGKKCSEETKRKISETKLRKSLQRKLLNESKEQKK